MVWWMQTMLIPKDFEKKMKKGFLHGNRMPTFQKNVAELPRHSGEMKTCYFLRINSILYLQKLVRDEAVTQYLVGTLPIESICTLLTCFSTNVQKPQARKLPSVFCLT